jgi:hypothetical protein
MADLSNNTALAWKIETTTGVFSAPSNSTDLVQCADVRTQIDGLTVTVNEYTGSVHKPGDQVLGKTLTISGKLYLRGPGGTTVPTADNFVPGRILRAAGFAEVVTSAAIPVSAEAGSAGATTSLTLGAGATGTANLYKGMMISITAIAATAVKRFTMIRAYTAGKLATLAETAGTSLGTSTYQIPKQLAFQLSPSGDAPTLSISTWLGNIRYDGVGMAVSSFKINLPTASRESNELPSIEFTLSGDLQATATEAAPVVAPGLGIPAFKDGKLFVNNVSLGGSSLTIDLNAQVAYPPNPNKVNGNDAAQLAETKRTANLTLNQVAPSVIDWIALADAQASLAIMAVYGSASGNMFGVIVTDCRPNYRSPDNGGQFVTNSGDLFIDGASKDISLVIPFF